MYQIGGSFPDAKPTTEKKKKKKALTALRMVVYAQKIYLGPKVAEKALGNSPSDSAL